MHFLWLAAFAFAVIVGVLVVFGFAMRLPVLRKLRKLPHDPGMPRSPQGAPYRGPH
jgi:predicted MFS family arabinose efflux permease